MYNGASVVKRRRSLIHPAWAMMVFWAFLYSVYILAPINQTPSVSLGGVVFVILHVLVFCAGSVLTPVFFGGEPRARASVIQNSGKNLHIFRKINVFFLVGIAGSVMSMLGKALLFEQISLLESAELRIERSQQLLESEPLSNSFLSTLGFLTYPAGFVALVLALVLYEELPRATRVLPLFYIIALFLLSLATGGRSTIFVSLLFICISIYIRKCRGLSAIPKSQLLKTFFLLIFIGFIVYSGLIWQTRSLVSGVNHNQFLMHADQNWGVTPSENLESLALVIDSPGLIQNFISTTFYFTQSVSIVERILEMSDPPLLLGAYHIDLVAAALRMFKSSSDFMGSGYAKLLENDVYGFFTSAWGALYIDFGLFGGYGATIVWGILAGLAHRRAKIYIYSDGFTQYVFWMYSILISFVSPPFGFSNSLVIFLWFLLYRYLRPSKKLW
jgi:oligosaccharide repeat unit polymerase